MPRLLAIGKRRRHECRSGRSCYREAQAIGKEQAPMMNIAHSIDFMPMSRAVKGYKIHPMGTHIFYGVDIED
ncbi:hypothetical protein [Marivita sp. GX14005]|uniref:hypothetical protein n=1 Tax=Marivita sp. GX14005 TaxID=2942276 RepID=UPI0020192777|nr:hypothetical protein [Marivita sp. GX14005]MCL3883203.1 hypothetical protein [Marivita sp. GX14005]